MTDDAVGLHVVRRVAALLDGRDDVVVEESQSGGLELVDLLAGFERAVLVDAFTLSDEEPGTVIHRRLEDFVVSHHLRGAHGVDLPTALEVGRRLGAAMPVVVDIVGVVVVDAFTLGEQLHPIVEASVEPAARRVLELLDVR